MQRLGAGLMDAAVDSFAVSCGAALGLLAWQRNGRGIAAVVAAMAAVLSAGIWRRR